MTPLRDIVHAELAAALENGYPLDTWTADAIADDLARYSPALDDRDPAELVPYVKDWLQSRRAVCRLGEWQRTAKFRVVA